VLHENMGNSGQKKVRNHDAARIIRIVSPVTASDNLMTRKYRTVHHAGQTHVHYARRSAIQQPMQLLIKILPVLDISGAAKEPTTQCTSKKAQTLLLNSETARLHICSHSRLYPQSDHTSGGQTQGTVRCGEVKSGSNLWA
jgi:hypothetical protein